MKEIEVYGSVTTEDGEFIKVVSTDGNDITDLFRDDMIKIAYENGEALKLQNGFFKTNLISLKRKNKNLKKLEITSSPTK